MDSNSPVNIADCCFRFDKNDEDCVKASELINLHFPKRFEFIHNRYYGYIDNKISVKNDPIGDVLSAKQFIMVLKANFDSPESYGEATIGYGTPLERKVPILDFVQTTYKDNRVITVSTLGDGKESQILSVENPASTGRASDSKMWLSKESTIGLLTTMLMYYSCKGISLEELLQEAIERGKTEIDYKFSSNLSPFTVPKKIENIIPVETDDETPNINKEEILLDLLYRHAHCSLGLEDREVRSETKELTDKILKIFNTDK